MPSQRGLLVFIGGEVAGLDLVSLESAYKMLHSKLVKSYAMDALLNKTREKDGGKAKKIKDFLEEAKICNESKYKSIGHGWDYRYEGLTVIGSALVYHETVIHTAFFRNDENNEMGQEEGRMSDYRRRRSFRG